MRRFLIVEDHPLFRQALDDAVRSAFPCADVQECSTLAEAVERIAACRDGLDLLLLDLLLPGVSGFDGLLFLRARFPGLPILVVSALDDPRMIRETLGYKAAGFVSKSADKKELGEAISRVLAGESYAPPCYAAATGSDESDDDALVARLSELTPQQIRVLQMVRRGKLNKQIAYELGVGEQTVKAHVSELLHKLNVVSRTMLVIKTANVDFSRFSSGDRVAGSP
jgi:DNA-binding NarL/FixJ family response regulator